MLSGNIRTENVGVSGKWQLEWDVQRQGYIIYQVDSDYYGPQDDYAESPGKNVWDGGSSGNVGLSNMRLDDRRLADSRQIWRLYEQEDGRYIIRNAYDGRYVQAQSDDRVKCVDDIDDATPIDIDMIRSLEGLYNGLTEPAKFYRYADPWMEDIPDEAFLSSVNIPGTHDTGTASIVQGAAPTVPITSCQHMFFDEQLTLGARAFDIRCNAAAGAVAVENIPIIHGGDLWECRDQAGDTLTLSRIFSDSLKFLEEHESETIILVIKPDDGEDAVLANAVGKFIRDNSDKFYAGSDIPSMGEARGKIVLMRRYAVDSEAAKELGLTTAQFGIDLTDWDSYDYSAQKRAVEIYSNGKDPLDIDYNAVYVQDAYKNTGGSKWPYITGTMAQTTGSLTGDDAIYNIKGNPWIFNYTSAARGFPLGITKDINPKLMRDSSSDGAGYIDNRRLGIMMLNFLNGQNARLIYESNTYRSGYDAKASNPTSVSITYDDTLGEAGLEGQCGDGTWTFDTPDYVPSWTDYTDRLTFSMHYTPKDAAVAGKTAKVLITEFSPKTVEIDVDDVYMEYGDTVPALTLDVDESQLVGTDKVSDLSVVLSVDWRGEDPDNPPPGQYDIKAEGYNSNLYDIKVAKAGKLTVGKRQLDCVWSDTSDLVYTGKPVNVTAELTGVLPGDDCRPVIEGGNETGPSWSGSGSGAPEKYTAAITGLTGSESDRYELPDNRSIDYYIRRAAADDFMFPQKAVMSYGQSLSEAELQGAAGAGSFKFIEYDEATETITEIGSRKPDQVRSLSVRMAYFPEDKAEKPAVSDDLIPVTAEPKEITVEARDTTKTYGDKTALDFTVDEKLLVGGDTKESLGLTLTAGAGDDDRCAAGTYDITMKECTNKNYRVTVQTATLSVEQRTISLSWPDTDSYVYDGEPAGVRAKAAEGSVLAEDTVTVKTTGGNRTACGHYTAVAVSVDNRNYKLPAKGLSFEYDIVKAQPAVTFPTAATGEYGTPLSQFTLDGADCDTAGRFVFSKDGSSILHVGDSGKKYALTFIPDDTHNYETVTQDVPVTVQPKSLTVKADDKKKTYSDQTPALTYRVDPSQFVNGDTEDSTGLTVKLTVGDGDYTYSDVGTYDITAATLKTESGDYAPVLKRGALTVEPLMAEIEWNDTRNLVYTGEPVSVTASVKNLQPPVSHGTPDDCTLMVEGGNEINASWTADDPGKVNVYEARITGLTGSDRGNYCLPDDGLTKKYLIRRATVHDYHFPSEAYGTYGDKVSELSLDGEAGDGQFLFLDGKGGDALKNDIVLDAGTHEYYMRYVPNDENVKPVDSTAPVTLHIKKKSVGVTANAAEKTYGEETELSCRIDDQLVNGDTKEDLNIVLTAGKNGEGDQRRSPAGEYEIGFDKSKANDNYDIMFTPALLTVYQREAGVSWSDDDTIAYT